MRLEVDGAADLLRMEYAEMPGLQLTFWQAQRLCNLSDDVCEGALALLMRAQFLVRTRDGRYRRPHPERGVEGSGVHSQPRFRSETVSA
jgi:hypothetical protein